VQNLLEAESLRVKIEEELLDVGVGFALADERNELGELSEVCRIADENLASLKARIEHVMEADS